ncbi:MAG: hypothetical protein ABSD27_09990 [Bryobacteraceae bacterium]|jgi:cold shock CspA family protein
MTGRIKSLSASSASGLIAAENGLSVHFQPSAVLAYDITCLAVGQLVTFDLAGGIWPRATNVCVLRQHHLAVTAGKHPEGLCLRYMGFDQNGSIRAYRYDRVSPGEGIRTFVVNADLALFRKHRVGVQDGPALCLHALTAELGAAGSPQQAKCERVLTDQDMLAHLARRPVPTTRPRPRWPRRTPVASHAE